MEQQLDNEEGRCVTPESDQYRRGRYSDNSLLPSRGVAFISSGWLAGSSFLLVAFLPVTPGSVAGVQAATPQPQLPPPLGALNACTFPLSTPACETQQARRARDCEGRPQQQCMPLGACHWHWADSSAKHGVHPCLRVDGYIDKCGAARVQCLPQCSLCEGQRGGLRAVRGGSGRDQMSAACASDTHVAR